MTQDSNRQMRLRHLAIVTLDPDRLAKFYCDVFGMRELYRKEESGNVFLTDGTITLAILRNKAEGKPNGLNHIGFHIDDREEIEKKLQEWNMAPPAKRPDDRPYAEVRMTDPDGNNIDLSLHGFDMVETNVDRDKVKESN
jgi:catechol 2,3-dioxygenase-like lactoylglutathione lyase family enzyme